MAKRGIAMVVALLLLATGAWASEIDLTSMSDEQLRELRGSIDAELAERGASNEDTLYEGEYIVGEDIKAGLYLFTCTHFTSTVIGGVCINVYSIPDDNDERRILDMYEVALGRSARLKLDTGMLVEVRAGHGTIRPFTANYMP